MIDDSGLGDGAGYMRTDPRTLKSKAAERIYALGDNTNVATSKAGSVAHFEAETVVENLVREIEGKLAFKWVYWNMLLPGHVPSVPLLPSHMSFMGKDVTTVPQMRHARSMPSCTCRASCPART